MFHHLENPAYSDDFGWGLVTFVAQHGFLMSLVENGLPPGRDELILTWIDPLESLGIFLVKSAAMNLG